MWYSGRRWCQKPIPTERWHLQVAHFLEADLQPWADALSAALFDPQPADGRREQAWNLLDALAPLGDAVDTVLRASELRLLEQLPRAPAEWQPAVISSHAVGGTLALSCSDIVACGGAMHAVRDVHSLTLHVATADRLNDVSLFRAALPCMETALTSLPALRTFKVQKGKHIPPGTRYVSLLMPVLARLPQLAHLDLRDNGIDAAVLAPPLASLTALTALNLDGNDLGKPGAAAIAPALSRLSRLASLTLARNRFHAAAVAVLPLGGLTALTALDLSHNPLLAPGVQALAPALDRLRKLAVLNLERTIVSVVGVGAAGGAAALAPPLGRLAALTALDLTRNHIRSDAMESLAPALSRLSRLAHLVLRENGMGAAGAAALAPPLGVLTALTLLDLQGGNYILADGAEALAPALSRLSMLAHLDLSCNRIRNRGVAALAPALGKLTALTRLDISNNGIGDAGVQHLVPAFARLTALQCLELRLGNDVATAGAPALQEVLPAGVWNSNV